VGGGGAEDMEGRSVLSLTLVYIILLDCSGQQLRCRTWLGSTLHVTPRHTGHGRHRCDFFIIRKELGKGEGVESSGYQGIFLFFFRTRNGRWLGGQFFGAGSRTIFGAGSETIFVLYFSLLHTKKRLHSRGEGGSVKVKRIIFYVAKNLPTPPYTHTLFISLFSLPHPPFLSVSNSNQCCGFGMFIPCQTKF